MIRVTCSISDEEGNVIASATGSIRESLEFTLRSFFKVFHDQNAMDALVEELEKEGHATHSLKIQREQG